MGRRVDVETRNVAASDVLCVVLQVARTLAAAVVFLPRNALPQPHEDRPRGIVGFGLCVIADDPLRRHGRAIALVVPLGQPLLLVDLRPAFLDLLLVALPELGKRLGIVRFIAVHPADEEWLVQVRAGEVVQVADHRHVRLAQRLDLCRGRALPQSDVEIYPGGLVARGILGVLEPDGNGEVVLALARPVLPLGVWSGIPGGMRRQHGPAATGAAGSGAPGTGAAGSGTVSTEATVAAAETGGAETPGGTADGAGWSGAHAPGAGGAAAAGGATDSTAGTAADAGDAGAGPDPAAGAASSAVPSAGIAVLGRSSIAVLRSGAWPGRANTSGNVVFGFLAMRSCSAITLPSVLPIPPPPDPLAMAGAASATPR